MAYDPKKDVTIKEFEIIPVTEEKYIKVCVHSYDNGPKKISIMEYIDKNGERRNYKLGRVTPEIAGKIAEVLAEAATFVSEKGE